MAKLSKEELIAKINEKLPDNNELAIELMEDITDSFEFDSSEYDKKLADADVKYNDLLKRYKDRFVSGEEVEEKEEVEEVGKEDAKVVDVESIDEIIDKKED